ncbi:MAG TPA: hypothetical protein VHO84_15590, partial [Syntrophorhabdaceae bacterium]|nr:hypothetical protein [Syntrophorhabdaceae bacterium]
MRNVVLAGIVGFFVTVICMDSTVLGRNTAGNTPMNKTGSEKTEEQNKETYADRKDFQSKANRTVKDLDSKINSLGDKV